MDALTIYDAPEPGKLILREGEAAMTCGVTTRTLRNWRSRGILKFVRIGRMIGYRPEDLAAFFAAGVQ